MLHTKLSNWTEAPAVTLNEKKEEEIKNEIELDMIIFFI